MTKAGWYPDKKMHNTLRYWDGKRWTDQTQPARGGDSSSVARGILIAVVGLGVAAVIIWSAIRVFTS